MRRDISLLTCVGLLAIVPALYSYAQQRNASGSKAKPLGVGNSVSGNSSPVTAPIPKRKERPLPSVVVGAPIKGAIAIDPVQKLDDKSGYGKLVYTFSAPEELEKDNTLCYLVLREIGKPANQQANIAEANATTTYPLKVTKGLALDPQFSPDGNYILLKIGLAFTTYDKFRLYVLDSRNMAVKLVSPRLLAYRKVWWSPDGEHLAYISGGDADGSVSKYAAGPQQLIVCDWKTGQEQTVLEDHIGLKLGVEWKDAQTLLYSDIGEDASLNSNLKEEKKALPPILRPNIYVYSLATGKSQILVKDGQKPSISPNKQWIAFYGSEDPQEPFTLNQDWWLRPGGAALSLANQLGGERKPFSIMSGLYPFIMWSHDSRFLVSLNQVKGSPHASAQIKEWNIDTGEQRLVSTITANDFEEVPRKPTYPQIYPLGISKDNKKLFVIKQEFLGKTGSWLKEISYLQSVDLATGNIQEMSESETPFGLDWLDLSDAIPD